MLLINIQLEALKELESVMERKFNSNASLRATQAGGVRAAANVMNYLKSNVEASVMRELTKKDKDIAKEEIEVEGVQIQSKESMNILGIKIVATELKIT